MLAASGLTPALDAFPMREQVKQESGLNLVKNSIRKLSWRKAVLLICLTTLLIPFPKTVVPEWRVRVVDANGKLVVGARVTLMWNDYTLGLEGSSERWTDADGYAVIPKQAGWASLLRRATFPVLASIFGPVNVHASYGFHANAWAVTKDNRSEIIKLDLQKGLPAEVVLLP